MDPNTIPNLPPAPDGFDMCHAGQRLAQITAGIDLDTRAEGFEQVFGPSLEVETPAAFANGLAEAKAIVASVYIKALRGPIEQDYENSEKLGRFWSAFADWSINRALEFAYQMPLVSRHLAADMPKSPAESGLFVFGLGKLGGCDLNYSSDVDLVAYFDPDRFHVRSDAGRTDVANRIMKNLTQLLTGSHGQRVWRVDWRLRPDPSVTGLAMSSHAGLDFHFFHAAPWRRLAMMKARPVAGDIGAGQQFLDELSPFLWRKTLDFRAIEELGGIKQRIRSEHPDLEEQRMSDVPLGTLAGFHVKLGAGGIREIEFIVNGLQLVWAGRQPSLRTPHTLTALRTLAQLGHMDSAEATALEQGYVTLRGLENRLQALNDGHVHTLPTKEYSDLSSWSYIEYLYDDINPDILASHFAKFRELIHERFSIQFGTPLDEPGADKAKENAPRVEHKLSDQQQAIVDNWLEGFTNLGLPREIAPRMGALSRALIDLVNESDTPEITIDKAQSYFRSLPPGGQYLRLLAEHPQLARDILKPLTEDGAMARLLLHSPHVVDLLIEQRGHAETSPQERADLGAFASAQRDEEAQLEAMRAHVNEMLYLAYLRLWRGEIDAAQARTLLTTLAIEALEKTKALVLAMGNKDGGVETADVSIAGFGKLGSAGMLPESDLDLVFLAHGPESLELEDVEAAHKFATRLKTALNANMRGGRIYEVDTRLRPSGASGAPTIRLATFENHQLQRAKTWEHIALVAARAVVAPRFASDAFEGVRAMAITKPRDLQQLHDDGHSMLLQLREHRIARPAKGTISIKLVPGGLMEAEYLISFLAIKHAPGTPKLVDIAYDDIAKTLEATCPELAGLDTAFNTLRDAHMYGRLFGIEGKSASAWNVVAKALDTSPEKLASNLSDATSLIEALVQQEIIKPSHLTKKKAAKYREEPVRWL